MKYAREFRDGALGRAIAREIEKCVEPGRTYRFMEFCGGHTHALVRHGIQDILPKNIEMIHGPGCPVCVLPVSKIDAALGLAHKKNISLCVYGDLMRAPGSNGRSFLRAKSAGADIRMIYSPIDAVRAAMHQPEREFVFMAIGFETTAPATALAIRLARQRKLRNFSVFTNHVLTPPAMDFVLGLDHSEGGDGSKLHGVIGPSHVSTIIGTAPYKALCERYAVALTVAGFEPLDLLQAILMLVHQVNDGECRVENQYHRAVNVEGNRSAQEDFSKVFDIRDEFEWRGLGVIPRSGLRINSEHQYYDAEVRHDLSDTPAADNPACECGSILRGAKKPFDCKLYGSVCTPENPIGACMVSSEGACAAHWASRPARSERVSTHV